MPQYSSLNDFREFEAVTQDLFQQAQTLGKEIPNVAAQTTVLGRDAKAMLLDVMKKSHERRTEEAILAIGQKEDLLIDRIVGLNDTIANLHVQLDTIDFIGTLKDIVDRFDDLDRFSSVNEEKRTVLVEAVSVIKFQPTFYKFSFGLAHLPMFALLEAFQDANRSFLGLAPVGPTPVREAVETLSKSLARDEVSRFVSCPATAKAMAELSMPLLGEELNRMAATANPFERIFRFGKILNCLWTHSRFVDLAVRVSEEHIQQLTAEFLGAVALLKGQLER